MNNLEEFETKILNLVNNTIRVNFTTIYGKLDALKDTMSKLLNRALDGYDFFSKSFMESTIKELEDKYNKELLDALELYIYNPISDTVGKYKLNDICPKCNKPYYKHVITGADEAICPSEIIEAKRHKNIRVVTSCCRCGEIIEFESVGEISGAYNVVENTMYIICKSCLSGSSDSTVQTNMKKLGIN